jgi:hypothetical protein
VVVETFVVSDHRCPCAKLRGAPVEVPSYRHCRGGFRSLTSFSSKAICSATLASASLFARSSRSTALWSPSSSVSRKLPGLHGQNPSLHQAFHRNQNPSRRRRRVASFHGFHVRASRRRRRSRRQAQVRHRFLLAPGRSATIIGPKRGVVVRPFGCYWPRTRPGSL